MLYCGLWVDLALNLSVRSYLHWSLFWLYFFSFFFVLYHSTTFTKDFVFVFLRPNMLELFLFLVLTINFFTSPSYSSFQASHQHEIAFAAHFASVMSWMKRKIMMEHFYLSEMDWIIKIGRIRGKFENHHICGSFLTWRQTVKLIFTYLNGDACFKSITHYCRVNLDFILMQQFPFQKFIVNKTCNF